RDVIIRAIVKAGHTPLRIDELNEPGDVIGQYINKIFSAKIVIVDVSMPNGNVYYELGIRQSLSNHPTILVAQVGSELPFDIQSQRVLFYDNSAVEKTRRHCNS